MFEPHLHSAHHMDVVNVFTVLCRSDTIASITCTSTSAAIHRTDFSPMKVLDTVTTRVDSAPGRKKDNSLWLSRTESGDTQPCGHVSAFHTLAGHLITTLFWHATLCHEQAPTAMRVHPCPGRPTAASCSSGKCQPIGESRATRPAGHAPRPRLTRCLSVPHCPTTRWHR